MALDILQVSKGLIRMNDVWEKIGHMLGHILAATLKVIWFILFRILL